ncbi:HNH endonuclease [Treponema sp. OttesenSCG-928-L16]|nr:HNH endonuclease [Treponema sp. OttesenSCG-928-L16]
MNILEQSLIEKAGYENGWECVKDNSLEHIRLASARHPYLATITTGPSDASWKISFSGGLYGKELRRNLPDNLFTKDGIIAWDMQVLGVVLRRAAELGIALPDVPERKYEQKIAVFLREHPHDRGTEREQMARQRIGQDLFREALMEYWKFSCTVTGIDIPEMLRASHAKPWKDCDSDAERLNVYNGFLLSANLDALFDSGLISFTDEGEIICSKNISPFQKDYLGLSSKVKLRWLEYEHLPFLRWHRERVFRR